MIKRFFIVTALILFAVMIYPLISDIKPFKLLSLVSEKYVADGPSELGAQNIVTSVVVTYRGLDTLGEIAVLFIATAGVGFLFRKKKALPSQKRESSELLQTASSFLYRLLLIFGIYIFIHGHLTPGGGFQGGVVLASGLLLLMLADIEYKPDHTIIGMIEGFSGATFVIIGLLGLIFAGGFLDNRIIPLGTYGRLFSGGAIGIIYSLIGLKVGSELTNILENYREDGL